MMPKDKTGHPEAIDAEAGETIDGSAELIPNASIAAALRRHYPDDSHDDLQLHIYWIP